MSTARDIWPSREAVPEKTHAPGDVVGSAVVAIFE